MEQFQNVRLVTNRYANEGIKKGDIGVILENYIKGYYLVDFSDVNGITITLDSFPEEDLELVEEELLVKLVCENTLIKGKLNLYEEAPDDNRQVLLEICFSGQKISKTENNFFEALQSLREELENKNIQILCNGAAKNVYPSPMQMSMGSGGTAYLLKLGQQAKNADIVNIFDYIDTLIFVSVKEQKEFYYEWIKSIVKK